MKNTKVFLCFILIFLLLYSYAYSLKVETHEDINEHIARNNTVGFSLDYYLKNNLGFINGAEQEVKKGTTTQEVFEWLGEGGDREDALLRYANHYHDPLDDWSTAGYGGLSAILWAQDDTNDGQLGMPVNAFAWQHVREYYHIALTGRDFADTVVAPDKAARGEYFAETFRGVGQLMHLVEDVSVPASAGINSGGNPRSI
jgi:hypothetical protein